MKAVRFTLKIEIGNASMSRKSDVAHALRVVARKVADGRVEDEGVIKDENGNTVGRWSFDNE